MSGADDGNDDIVHVPSLPGIEQRIERIHEELDPDHVTGERLQIHLLVREPEVRSRGRPRVLHERHLGGGAGREVDDSNEAPIEEKWISRLPELIPFERNRLPGADGWQLDRRRTPDR